METTKILHCFAFSRSRMSVQLLTLLMYANVDAETWHRGGVLRRTNATVGRAQYTNSSWLHSHDVWGVEHGQAFQDTLSLLRRGLPCSYIDIGAHHGTTVRMAAIAGCRAWAFETNPGALQILKKHVSQEPYQSLVDVFTDQPADRVVPDDVWPTMVKIDVDGADFEVAKRASRLLDRSLSVHVELAPRKQGGADGALQYMRYLWEKGFALYPHWVNHFGPHERSDWNFNTSEGAAAGITHQATATERARRIIHNPARQLATPRYHALRSMVLECGGTAEQLTPQTVRDLAKNPFGSEMDVWGVRIDECRRRLRAR
jgi:hypothetical protein